MSSNSFVLQSRRRERRFCKLEPRRVALIALLSLLGMHAVETNEAYAQSPSGRGERFSAGLASVENELVSSAPSVSYSGRRVAEYAPSPLQERSARENVEREIADAGAEQGLPRAVQEETLEQALQNAVEQSRTQRALALKRGASQSATTAARTLRNPKISNTTTYVGLLNQPRSKTDVDLSGTMGTLAGSLPSDVLSAVAPALSSLPTQMQIATPLVDKNFVTTVTSVTVPIYLGGRVEALAQEAEAMTQAIEAGEEVDLQKVKLETIEAYFLVLRTRSLRQVAIDAVETAKSHLDDATRMENVGILTKNVVLAAQVAYSEARQTELRVATAQKVAETAYNRVQWRPLDSPVALQDREPEAPLENVEELMNAAVATRGELKALSAEGRALQAQVNVARADVRPQVAALGAYSYVENSHITANSNATAAIGVTWTPFDGGTSRARQQAARQNAMAVARMREETESEVRAQVRQAWLLQKEARERIDLARIAVEQATENHRVVTRGFQEGTLNHTEALDAATRLTAAKSSYANAKYDAILATERLRSAVGNL